MSTKIFNAYRISIKQDILKFFDRMRDLCNERIAQDEKYLYAIHAVSLAEAVAELKKNENDMNAENMVKADKRGDIDTYWITKHLKKCQLSPGRELVDMFFSCSVFPTDDFYYLKFYPNNRWMMDVLDKTVEEFKDILFDYHYQNSTDPPKNISFKDFEKRSKQWDEIMGGDDFTRGLIMEIYTPNSFEKLISKNYYTGKKTNEELYSHLAYKFDKKLKEETTINN